MSACRGSGDKLNALLPFLLGAGLCAGLADIERVVGGRTAHIAAVGLVAFARPRAGDMLVLVDVVFGLVVVLPSVHITRSTPVMASQTWSVRPSSRPGALLLPECEAEKLFTVEVFTSNADMLADIAIDNHNQLRIQRRTVSVLRFD
jgi:hypothetical protein